MLSRGNRSGNLFVLQLLKRHISVPDKKQRFIYEKQITDLKV